MIDADIMEFPVLIAALVHLFICLMHSVVVRGKNILYVVFPTDRTNLLFSSSVVFINTITPFPV